MGLLRWLPFLIAMAAVAAFTLKEWGDGDAFGDSFLVLIVFALTLPIVLAALAPRGARAPRRARWRPTLERAPATRLVPQEWTPTRVAGVASVVLILVLTAVGIFINPEYVSAILVLPLPLVLVSLWAWPRPRRVPLRRHEFSGMPAEEPNTTTER